MLNRFTRRFADRAQVTDGALTNALTGLGWEGDRQAGTSYTRSYLSDATLAATYEGSSVGAKIVDIPAFDATREWRSLASIRSREVRAIEARLDLKRKVLDVVKSARLYGGAALYASDGYDPREPLRGPIRGLRVLQKQILRPCEKIDQDLSSPHYGQPLWYELVSPTAEPQSIHPSRLALFYGVRRPEGGFGAPDMWGLSALSQAYGPLKALDAALHNASALFHKAVVDTLSMPDLVEILQKPGGEEVVRARLTAFKTGMSVHNLAALDGKETLSRPEIKFQGQDKMIQEFTQAVAAAADIPVTRLFGRSPAGMNATGAGDMRNYYDRVRALQETEIGPSLAGFDRVILAEAGVEAGVTPADFTWNPLWQESKADKAKTALDMTDTLTTAVREGVLEAEPAKAALTRALTDLGLFQGL